MREFHSVNKSGLLLSVVTATSLLTWWWHRSRNRKPELDSPKESTEESQKETPAKKAEAFDAVLVLYNAGNEKCIAGHAVEAIPTYEEGLRAAMSLVDEQSRLKLMAGFNNSLGNAHAMSNGYLKQLDCRRIAVGLP